MKRAVPTGLTPRRPGLEREEPELGYEEDVPTEDANAPAPDESTGQSEEQPLRQVERE